MKRVLITGAHGYIGQSLTAYVRGGGSMQAEGISLRGENWEAEDLSGYDSIVHLAGIAHRKETKENRHLYYDVNRDLSVRVAEKAKREHVKQFIYISTMAVYGKNSGVVTKDTVPTPKTNYGKSKLEAENLLRQLEDEQFKVCIIRPPMVYGLGCKGNFQTLVKLAERLPVFPKVNNQRSMIYIDNLCEYMKRSILECGGGISCPQNEEYVSTDEIVTLVAQKMGKKLHLSRVMGVAACCIRPFSKMADKAFGSFIYVDDGADHSYCVVGKEDSILRSVGLME